jgi:hypothetical protein
MIPYGEGAEGGRPGLEVSGSDDNFFGKAPRTEGFWWEWEFYDGGIQNRKESQDFSL